MSDISKQRVEELSEPGTKATRGAILLRYKNAPGPHGHFLLGSTREIRHDPLRFGLAMTDAIVTMLDQWQDFAMREQPLDIAAEMLRLTLRIVGQTFFNIDLNDETHIVGQAVTTVNKLHSDYIYAPFPPLHIPTPRNRRLQVSYRALDQVVRGIITNRRSHNTDTGDLLSMLLLARDEKTGQGMDDQQVRDEVITLLIAGYETLSTALTWTWYCFPSIPTWSDSYTPNWILRSVAICLW